MPGVIRVGISGWRYAPWRGPFYPDSLPQREELRYASERFSAIEINGTFYSLQRPESFRTWAAATPRDFRFAIKGSRYITHLKKLLDVRTPLANFFASGVLALEEKLGPFLWQFPPGLVYDPNRFHDFFTSLPRDTEAARKLAEEHDERLAGRAFFATAGRRRLRHAVEVRNPSFFDPKFIHELREQNIALVIADSAGRFPYTEDLTADFTYLRLHGPTELYRSGYGRAKLDQWASRILAFAKGDEPRNAKRITPPDRAREGQARDVYCFFDNTDDKLRAPFDAQALIQRLGRPRSPATSSTTRRV